jgi:hypothetical protein
MSSYFSIDNFLTEVRDRGVARPNRFEVTFPLPSGLSNSDEVPDNRLVCLFCESANLPSKTIGVKNQKIYGPSYPRPFNSEYGDTVSMTFLVDSEMDVKGFFDAWMNIIVDPYQYFVYYPDNYTVPITISQLDEEDNKTYSVTLEDAFPRNIALMDLSQSSQNSAHKLNVTFTYRRWFSYHKTPNSIKYPEVWENTSKSKSNPLSQTVVESSDKDLVASYVSINNP